MHGSRFTFAAEYGPWLQGEEALTLGPALRESSSSLYFNRATEVGWMWLRILPALQWSESGFGEAWTHRWILLDTAFERMEASLAELGKPVATAIQELMAQKFPFQAQFRFGNSPRI